MVRRRVPVVLQMTMADCGAACLSMIVRYWGGHCSLSQGREYVGGGRDGVTALMLANAARALGLEVAAYRLAPDAPEAMGSVALPAIAHWQDNHFVVVESWSRQQAVVVDPAVGRCRLSAAEWQAAFSGVVLTCSPTAAFSATVSRPPNERRRSPWYALLRHLWRLPGIPPMLVQMVLASLLLQALGLALPLFTRLIVDRVLPSGTTGPLFLAGVGMVLFVVAQATMGYLREVLAVRLQTRLDAQVMIGFFAHLLALPYRFFQERTSGDMLMRLDSTATIRETLTGRLIASILDGVLVTGYLLILLVLAPGFGALVVLVALVQTAILVGTARPMHSLSQRTLSARTSEESYLVEVLHGITTVKASGADRHVLDQWTERFFASLRLSLQRSQLAILTETSLTTLHLFIPLILLWSGTLAVLDGSMSAGTMLGLTLLAAACLSPLSSLIAGVQQLPMVRAQLERLLDVLQTEREQPTPPQPDGLAAVQGRLEVRGVHFGYTPHAPPLLRDISFTVAPGQKVAIVGRTGSGKTTLARLLPGLYRPARGEIVFDGVPIEHLDYRWLRQQIGLVPQDVWLFAGSIRENIALHRPHLSLADIEAAARVAALHDEVMAWPMGYETRVAEGGAGLSGGMRQRIALARAIVHRPALVILDEATSHLDSVTEQHIDRQLQRLGCTQVVISHRRSSVCTADVILVLDDGRVVERGTHAELLAMGGVYAALMG